MSSNLSTIPCLRLGLYVKLGKFAPFERQNDRHLESYGLISTAFNRFEDQGLEAGLDVGRHVYLRAAVTQGNPVFFRDPNALAGDNGTPERDPVAHPHPDPELASGFPILYDAEVEEPDFGGDLEFGFGLGVRFGEPGGGRELNLLAWHHERDLADAVDLTGTFYGGDLDLLDGPFGENGAGAGLPIRGDKKIEVGANLWLYWDGLSLFGQYVGHYARALELAPSSYDAHYGLGVCDSYSREHTRAIESFRRALQASPHSAAARLALWISLLQNGETAAAIGELHEAARLEPGMRQAYYQLGRAYQSLGRSAEAEAAFAKTRELGQKQREFAEGLLEPGTEPR